MPFNLQVRSIPDSLYFLFSFFICSIISWPVVDFVEEVVLDLEPVGLDIDYTGDPSLFWDTYVEPLSAPGSMQGSPSSSTNPTPALEPASPIYVVQTGFGYSHTNTSSAWLVYYLRLALKTFNYRQTRSMFHPNITLQAPPTFVVDSVALLNLSTNAHLISLPNSMLTVMNVALQNYLSAGFNTYLDNTLTLLSLAEDRISLFRELPFTDNPSPEHGYVADLWD